MTGRSEVLRSFAAVMVGTPYIQFILTDVRVAVIREVAVVTCMENVLTPGTERGAVFAAGRAVGHERLPPGRRRVAALAAPRLADHRAAGGAEP